MSDQRPPDAAEIAAIGKHVLELLPEEIRTLLGDVPVTVEEWAETAVLKEMEIEDGLDLTGLYRAVPIAQRHDMSAPVEPEMIFLYRMPILFEWCERGVSLEEVVFDVLTHEIGHHLGMDETQALRMEGRRD